MATVPTLPPERPNQPLRLRIDDASSPHRTGSWWPRSRDLAVEIGALVDGFPPEVGRIDRVLFSRPDWTWTNAEGVGLRRASTRRGQVKVGSFPGDDTKSVVLTMAGGWRLRLQVVAHDSEPGEAGRRSRTADAEPA